MRFLVALLSLFAFAGSPAAFAQSTSQATDADVLVQGNWRLPKSHRYEAYIDSTYVKVDLGTVPGRLDKKQQIYDRTAKKWVYHPSTGINPAYTVAAAAVSAPARPTEMHVAGNWRLPATHRYEWYTPQGDYRKLDLGEVAGKLDAKQPVYDRTAKLWVYQANSGVNQRYVVGSAIYPPGVVPSPAAGASTPPAGSPVAPPPSGPAPAVVSTPAPAPATAATTAAAPGDKDDCKKGGWKQYSNPSFKNQGDCVSWVNQNRKK